MSNNWFAKGLIKYIGAFLLLVIGGTPLIRAQMTATDWEQAAGGKMSFDVTSVKRDTATPGPNTVSTLVPLGPGNVYTPTGGLFRTTNYPLIAYIVFAYKMGNFQLRNLIPTLPKFVSTDRFDIEAHTLAGANPTKDQMRLMIQSVLADRFKLAIRTETKQLPIFALILDKPGKTGPNLRPYPDGTPCSSLAPTGASSGPPQIVEGLFPMLCTGILHMTPSSPGLSHLGARNVTIQLMAQLLPAFGDIDRAVYDRTGLTGSYDFSLEFQPELPRGALAPRGDTAGPTFLEALKGQLGLKLESATGPVDIYVIDHIEEPSPN